MRQAIKYIGATAGIGAIYFLMQIASPFVDKAYSFFSQQKPKYVDIRNSQSPFIRSAYAESTKTDPEAIDAIKPQIAKDLTDKKIKGVYYNIPIAINGTNRVFDVVALDINYVPFIFCYRSDADRDNPAKKTDLEAAIATGYQVYLSHATPDTNDVGADWSSAVTASGSVYIPPPSNINVKGGPNSMTVSWNPFPENSPDAVEIIYWKPGTSPKTNQALVPGNNSVWNIINITVPGKYNVSLRCHRGMDTGSYSFEHSADVLPTPLKGDIDGNGIVDLTDLILALKIMGNIDTNGIPIHLTADVNGDGKIGLEEVIYILQEISQVRELQSLVEKPNAYLGQMIDLQMAIDRRRRGFSDLGRLLDKAA
ncbi:MAG: hypothetical protein ABIC04_08300 [Nanoarchaeota archaeon]